MIKKKDFHYEFDESKKNYDSAKYQQNLKMLWNCCESMQTKYCRKASTEKFRTEFG